MPKANFAIQRLPNDIFDDVTLRLEYLSNMLLAPSAQTCHLEDDCRCARVTVCFYGGR